MKYIILLPVLLACTLAAQAQNINKNAMRKLQMAEFAITNLYVDSVDEDKLVEEAIVGMLEQLAFCRARR